MLLSMTRACSRVRLASPSLQANFATVTASMVKELRETSGAPMMDCKKALTESGGEIEKAMDWLRAKGIAKASKSASREATEGLVAIKADKENLLLIEVNSETDFVSRNDDFHAFVQTIADKASETGVEEGKIDVSAFLQLDGGALQNKLTDAINVIRENIVVRRIEKVIPRENEVLSTYVHGKVFSGDNIVLGTQAAVVGLHVGSGRGTTPELSEIGHKLAMHVIAASPLYASTDSVPSDFLDREKVVLREQMEESGQTEGKKPDMLEKILAGKVNKRLSEVCLSAQAHFAEEGSPVIEKYLISQANALKLDKLAISRFWRWSLGSNSE